jgi:hypothetical protein
MTFIRPLLEYSCEVWDSCTVADAGRLEQLQLEAAKIVTGLTAYASLSSLLQFRLKRVCRILARRKLHFVNCSCLPG